MDEVEEDQEVAAVTDAEVAAAEETVTALLAGQIWTSNPDREPGHCGELVLSRLLAGPQGLHEKCRGGHVR